MLVLVGRRAVENRLAKAEAKVTMRRHVGMGMTPSTMTVCVRYLTHNRRLPSSSHGFRVTAAHGQLDPLGLRYRHAQESSPFSPPLRARGPFKLRLERVK